MSIEIKICIPDFDHAGAKVEKSALLAEDMAALGFARRAAGIVGVRPTQVIADDIALDLEAARQKIWPDLAKQWRDAAGFGADFAIAGTDGGEISGKHVPLTDVYAPEAELPEEAQAAKTNTVPDEAPKRKRRSKAEMEAARAAEAAGTPQISTGQNRVGPDDDDETAAQDAADEAAEVAEHRDANSPLTLDDVRHAVGACIRKFGMAAAVTLVPAVLGCKVEEVPDTQDALAEAIAKLDAAVKADVPLAALAKPEPQITASTKDNVVDALKAYALKFDGQNTKLEAQAVPKMNAMMLRVLEDLFGLGVSRLSQVPDDPATWAKLETAVRAEMEG